MNCRYCNKPVPESELAITRGYWSGTKDVCHKSCKQAGEQQEALDCQVIDSDCNDCRHYQRGKLAPKTVSLLKTKDGKTEEVVFKPNLFIGGLCRKFNKMVLAQPNKWSGLECFEHRRL